jgi:hypothetical protein
MATQIRDLLASVEIDHKDSITVGNGQSMATFTESTLSASFDRQLQTQTQLIHENVVNTQLVDEANRDL